MKRVIKSHYQGAGRTGGIVAVFEDSMPRTCKINENLKSKEMDSKGSHLYR